MAENDQNDTDRSQEPTQKRLDEALKRGDVVKSQEVSTWFVISGATLVMAVFAGSMAGSLQTTLRGLIANSYQIPVDGNGLMAVYQRLTGAEGMGGGDIKLLAMIGALVGWQGVLFTIFFSSALGTLAGLAYIVATRRSAKARIPFGPFLAAGAVAYWFVGRQMIDWYLGWMR